MATSSARQKNRENSLDLLDAAIEAVNLAKEMTSATPAKAVFGTVAVLLTTIKVRLLPSCNDELRVYTYPGHDEQ